MEAFARLAVDAVERPENPKGGAVEELPAGVEGEEERAADREELAPLRDAVGAEDERVLQLPRQLRRELGVDELVVRDVHGGGGVAVQQPWRQAAHVAQQREQHQQVLRRLRDARHPEGQPPLQ